MNRVSVESHLQPESDAFELDLYVGWTRGSAGTGAESGVLRMTVLSTGAFIPSTHIAAELEKIPAC